MRRLKVTVVLVFILACVVYGGYTVKSKMIEDHTPPVITCKEDTVTISVQAEAEEQEKALLEGVTAEDNRDGDLTKSIRIASMSHFTGGHKRTVNYVVFDKSNQAGTLQRTVEYSDYTSPKIKMEKPLKFRLSELDKVNITENMTAEDCLDGDLSNQIRTEVGGGYYSMVAGDVAVTAQVSNSAGDVRSIPMTMSIVDDSNRDERMKEYPLLSHYILYTKVGAPIEPMNFLIGTESNGNEMLFEQNPVTAPVIQAAVGINAAVDYTKPGVYTVEYSYTAENAPTAVTRMYVVVEE